MKKFNFYTGAYAAAKLLAILVILSELIKPFKTFLASVFTHHWIAKAVLVTIAFVIFGFVYKKDGWFGISNKNLAWYATLGSLAIIFLFYIFHFLA